MAFKINIAERSSGRTYKIESESEFFNGKSLNEKVKGEEISPDLKGYEFEISGTSDRAGFTSHKDVEGIGLKKILLRYGKAMKKRPRREGKRKQSNPTPDGLRLRKTVRGKVISPMITQINLVALKEGEKKLSEIFPEQNKSPEKEPEKIEEKVEEKSEEKSEEKVEKKIEEKSEEKAPENTQKQE